MGLPSWEQATAPGGGQLFVWPENEDLIASSSRFNSITHALFSFIKTLESSTDSSVSAIAVDMQAARQTILQHTQALADRYTKAEAGAEMSAVVAPISADLAGVHAELSGHAASISDRYTKAETDTAIAAIDAAVTVIRQSVADLNTLYQTDAEAAAAIAALSSAWDLSSNDFRSQVNGWLLDRYTKAESDQLLSLKANVGASYTKAESDATQAAVGAALADRNTKAELDQKLILKADKTSVYSKDDIDQALTQKASANHNHQLRIGDGSFLRITMGSQEQLEIAAGSGINIDYDDNLNKVTVNLKPGVTWSELGGTQA